MIPQINPNAREWRLVEEWALKRLHDYRKSLESPTMDEKQTTILRAKIGEVKALIALGLPTPQPTMEEYPDHD